MSREERRNYQRMMKNMERGPALPPAARARAERNAQRRARRAQPEAAGALSRRFWIRSVLIAIALGFLVFSLQWGNGMPFALYAGLAVGFVVLLIIVGFRLLQRRAGAS
jgi:predicted PurR-regulated permease PerM